MWSYLRKNSATMSVEPFSVIACFWAWDVAAMVFKSKISKMIWVTLTYQIGQSQQSLQNCRDSTSSGGRNSWSCNHPPQKINFISFSILIVQLHPMRLRGMFIWQLWVFMLLLVHISKANLKKTTACSTISSPPNPTTCIHGYFSGMKNNVYIFYSSFIDQMEILLPMSLWTLHHTRVTSPSTLFKVMHWLVELEQRKNQLSASYCSNQIWKTSAAYPRLADTYFCIPSHIITSDTLFWAHNLIWSNCRQWKPLVLHLNPIWTS